MNPQAGPSSDHAARLRIRESLDESLIVEASAGTGKTTALVQRLVAVLGSGRTTVDRIAAVTFTHKAAGELKLRLREQLDKARHDRPAEANLLEHALEHLEEASIVTIHGFCAQILRERPVEALVDPAFEEMSEAELTRIFQKAFRSWLERSLADTSPALRRAFARLAWRDSWDDSPALERLQAAGRKLVEWRDYPLPWRREPFAREEEMNTILRLVRELAVISGQPRNVNDRLYQALSPLRNFSNWLGRAEQAGARDWDTLESLLLKLSRDLRSETRRGKGSGDYGGGALREDLLARREELLNWIEQFRVRADADLAASLRDEMQGLVEEYSRRKRRLGKLDFVDLLVLTRDVLLNQPEVRNFLQRRFTHLFVDEFQDTDPLQAEILFLLSADDPAQSNWLEACPVEGKLFLVGDPKQSIYKFRRADIVLYRKVRDALTSRGVGLVQLTTSFRSVRNLQNFVNAAFEDEMDQDRSASHAEWAPLQQYREDIEGCPSVVALPVPRPYGSKNVAVEPVKACLFDAIGAYCAWLVKDSGWGIAPRDIAVLFRKRNHGSTDLTRETVRALEARGIPHLLAGSKSFHHREEVETLRVALTAVEWPDDELSVFSTLKGPLFAIADEELLKYRHQHRRLHPFRIEGSETGPVPEALAILAELHRGRNAQPIAATVHALLRQTRAYAGFLLRPGGNQVLANVFRVADLARNYELSGGISFRGFVEELTAQAEKEEAAEAPVLEEDSDGVRLMTVHSAKGLEFRVVILADLMTHLSRKEPEASVDGQQKLCAMALLGCQPWELRDNASEESARDRAEGLRVAYVAATRARDLLVIPAVGDGPYPDGTFGEGWLSPLTKALYPARAEWRKSKPAPGCPRVGAATVLSRPADYDREGEISVRPGIITPQAGNHEVVWWDPASLELGQEAEHGLRQKEILKDDGGASMAAYLAWKSERIALIARGSLPSVDVLVASQAVVEPPQAAEAVEVIALAGARRSAGKRFGTLVHAILRDVRLDSDRDEIARSATLNGRVFGATPEEVADAQEAAANAIAHPVLERARRAERCHREYPVMLRLEQNRVLEGVIDLAFVENGSWIIVDFKTDADTTERLASYERQLQWYAYAMMQLAGLPARAILLGV